MKPTTITQSVQFEKPIERIESLKNHLQKLAEIFLHKLKEVKNEHKLQAKQMTIEYEELIKNLPSSKKKQFVFPIFNEEVIVVHALHHINGNNESLRNPVKHIAFIATSFIEDKATPTIKQRLHEFAFKEPGKMKHKSTSTLLLETNTDEVEEDDEEITVSWKWNSSQSTAQIEDKRSIIVERDTATDIPNTSGLNKDLPHTDVHLLESESNTDTTGQISDPAKLDDAHTITATETMDLSLSEMNANVTTATSTSSNKNQCSAEEIEQKRQAAKQRLQMTLSKLSPSKTTKCSAEVIEQKRQAAKRRLQMPLSQSSKKAYEPDAKNRFSSLSLASQCEKFLRFLKTFTKTIFSTKELKFHLTQMGLDSFKDDIIRKLNEDSYLVKCGTDLYNLLN